MGGEGSEGVTVGDRNGGLRGSNKTGVLAVWREGGLEGGFGGGGRARGGGEGSSLLFHSIQTSPASHPDTGVPRQTQNCKLRIASQFKSELFEGHNQSNLLAFHPPP